jgi:hypothetical protein
VQGFLFLYKIAWQHLKLFLELAYFLGIFGVLVSTDTIHRTITVFMHRYPLLLLFLAFMSFGSLPAIAQKSIRVSGTVLQPDKVTPVAGAGIIRFGTQSAVVSDQDGKFLIDIQQEDTLLIRAIGFKPLMYLPKRLPVSELRVTIVLQQDTVMLGEVEVRSRPSDEMIQRALRNMKREASNLTMNPGYIPNLEPPPPPVPVAPTALNPMSLLYDMLSKEGKERKKLQELYLLLEYERIKREKEAYNRFFKDNTGYD